MPVWRRRSSAHRWSFGLLTLLLVIVSPLPLPAARADGAVPSSRRLSSLPCTDNLFVGVRGSGEEGVEGTVLPGFRRAITPRLPGTTTAVYLDYPAVSTHSITQDDVAEFLLDDRALDSDFFASVTAGVTELRRVLTQNHSACPDRKVIVVAFSQGAEVATTVLAEAPEAQWITASLLLGNPRHYPGQHVRERDGQVSSPAFGMQALLDYLRQRQVDTHATQRSAKLRLALQDVFRLYEGRVDNAAIASSMLETASMVPATYYQRTFSVCAVGDVVCDFTPAMSRLLASTSSVESEINQARPVHGGYTPEQTQRTLDMVVRAVDPSAVVSTSSGPTIPVEPASPSASPQPTEEAAPVGTNPVTAQDVQTPWWPVALAGASAGVVVGGLVGWRMGRRR